VNKYVISDIHGCYFTLRELLNKIGLSKEDEIYFLGDYIDRGPNSKEVIDYLIELKKSGYNLHTLKGNHEEMVFDSIELEEWTEGAAETLNSFGIKHFNQLDKKYVNWLTRLKPYLENGNHIFVHAGLNFNYENPLDCTTDMAWIRNWYDSINYDWLQKRVIIHGHLPISQNEIEKMLENITKNQYMNIDNGCFIKDKKGFGKLCCLELTKLTLTFQDNID